MKRNLLFIFFCFSLLFKLSAQGNFVLQKGKEDKISFKLINNLIVIPVEINGVELSFLLDTGVTKPIIFNFLNLTEELKINQTELIYIRGLGEGEPMEALRSRNNVVKIGDAINVDQDLFAVFDPSLNFAPRLGVPIHGIIGYDFLKDFVVEVNYSRNFLKIIPPNKYSEKDCKKCSSFDLEFHHNKPYMMGEVTINGNKTPVKLLIDSGGSDALWLFEDKENNITVPEKFFVDFLGQGLSGSVYGKRSVIDKVSFSDFDLKRVNVAFPDSTSISYAKKIKDRNGSLSGEILKRFNVVLNYPKKKISLKKNNNYGKPFMYNKSGITLEHSGVRVVKEQNNVQKLESGMDNSNRNEARVVISTSYKFSLAPAFTVVELRENSPAKRAGLEIGDVVLAINNKSTHLFSLQEVIQFFYEEDGKRLKLLVERKGVKKVIFFRLESLLK
ncbi:aspartyl protease family protein [Pontimicrobium sp. IMCC45349]|uniref:aspartyl protease family protein n=1 Tax=Pontimicrobium sp. IMCC45349 TaxID=3391574 RepID=UPI0039A282C3